MQCEKRGWAAGNRALAHRTRLVVTALSALAGTICAPLTAQADQAASTYAAGGATLKRVVMVVNKSRTLSVGRAFTRALVGGTEFVDVLPLNEHSIYIQAKKVGATNVSLVDPEGRLEVLKKSYFVFAHVTRGSRGGDRRCKHDIGYVFASSSTLQANSSRCRQDLRNANEIVGGSGQDEEPFNQCPSAMARFAQATDGLDPAEGFLDPLPLDRADAIARVAGGAGIDRRAAVRVVLRDVRRAATFAASGHEVSGIVVLIAAHRAAGSDTVLDHIERGLTLRRAVRLGHPGINDEPVAVLRHQMSHVTELGFLARALAEQPGIWIAGRGMRVVLALLAMEIAFSIASTAAGLALARRRIAALFWYKALHAGPGLDQRAIHREVLAGKQLAYLRKVQHLSEELGRDIAREQPIPVLAEYRRIPHRIVRRQPDKPAEQQIVVELLH